MGCAASTAKRRRKQAVMDKRYRTHSKDTFERRAAAAIERRQQMAMRASRKRKVAWPLYVVATGERRGR